LSFMGFLSNARCDPWPEESEHLHSNLIVFTISTFGREHPDTKYKKTEKTG
jgi:hypothetical protein